MPKERSPGSAALADPSVELVYDLIASVYAGYPDRYARLSKHGRVTKRTAHHWLTRGHAPRLPHIFSLLTNSPEFRVAFLAMVARMSVKL